MPDLNRPSMEGAFSNVKKRMIALLQYANAALLAVKDEPTLLAEHADSVIVLAVARLDWFFQDAVSIGTLYREEVLRKHFAKHGERDATECDLPTLVKKVRRRVSFKDDGARLDNVFRLMFQCSVWPTDEIRDCVLDLVLLRNFVVHGRGQDWSHDGRMSADYAPQFRRADVLDVRRYGAIAVYSVDSYRALQFFRSAIQCIIQQLQYLEERLVRDLNWAEHQT
jgi:hypothetical protein